MVLLASRGQLLEKTSGGSLDLSSVLGTAHANERSLLPQKLLVWIQFLAHLHFTCAAFEYQKLGSSGSHTQRGKGSQGC